MKRKKIINIILLITWMIIIFLMSSFPGNESSEQSNFIVNIIIKLFNISNLELLGYIVRKLAHISEFFILGLLFINLMKLYNKRLYLGIIFSYIYAITDELHQLFIPDRSCQITDTLIDLIGIVIAYVLYILIKRITDRNNSIKKV